MTNATSQPHRNGPGRSTDEVLAALDAQLSLSQRLAYLAVGVAGAAVAALVGTLWATEPTLPLRTHVAFGAIVAIGLAWTGVATFVLTRRRPLYGKDRVLATGVAVVASVTVGAGAVVIAVLREAAEVALAAGVAASTVAAAAIMLHVQARARRRELLERRRQLEESA